MKKITILSICLLSIITAKAQITVTSADMPNAGDSVLVSVTNTIGSLDATLTGANYNWDYSTLTRNSQQEIKFDSPFSFPTVFAVLFNILNTSYGQENRNFTSLPIPGVTLSAAYDFLKKSSSMLKQNGAGYTINGTPLPFLYSPADVRYRFPMNYNNTDSCDYAFGLPIPTIGYYGETGHRVNVVDGWGSLTTPYGTFPTLRIKSVISSIDSIYISAFSFGSNVPRPKKIEYKWFTNGKEIPLLEIDANIVGANPVVSNVQYIDSIHSSSTTGIIENKLNANANVFPNPFVDNAMVQYNLTTPSAIKITITDVVGKTVATILDETQSIGVHQTEINVEDLHLTGGIYFLNLQANNYKEVKKIAVAR